MDVYEEMAEHYDLIYCDTVDLDFYLREARNARGPVLEVACGTGRILLKLATSGIEACGIDLSPAMLRVLRKKASALGISPDVRVADMTDFSLAKEFSLIIVPYRSFLHLKDETARKKALSRFMAHLRPGGRLILHTYNPSADDLAMTGTHHLFESENMVSADGRRYRLDWYLMADPKARTGSYRIAISFDGGGRHEFSMEIRYPPMKDIRKHLEGAGFRNIRLYCGFDYSPFDEGCREAVWIAER
jgi:SAM-dependent methyltransferase